MHTTGNWQRGKWQVINHTINQQLSSHTHAIVVCEQGHQPLAGPGLNATQEPPPLPQLWQGEGQDTSQRRRQICLASGFWTLLAKLSSPDCEPLKGKDMISHLCVPKTCSVWHSAAHWLNKHRGQRSPINPCQRQARGPSKVRHREACLPAPDEGLSPPVLASSRVLLGFAPLCSAVAACQVRYLVILLIACLS